MRSLDPIGHRARHAFDVRRQRRVVLDVITRVLAHDVDDARTRFLRVVQIGEPVAESRRQMQQRGGRLARHPVIAIRRARHHALEQTQNAAHAFDTVECGDKMHLGRARIGKTDVHIAVEQRAHETFCTVQ